jgi:hypothetical protein
MSEYRYICGCCGAEVDVKKVKRSDYCSDWMEFVRPDGKPWKIPSAKKELADGSVIYFDTYNNVHSREEFLDIFGVDPEKAIEYIRSHIRVKRTEGSAAKAASH